MTMTMTMTMERKWTPSIWATGEEWTIRADCVVGCDGAHSAIRQSLDIPVDGGPM